METGLKALVERLMLKISAHLKEARQGFFVAIVFAKQRKIPKKDISQCRQTIDIFATLLLSNTLRALMTSYRLPRQHTKSAKRPSKFQLLKIIGKTKSVTYRFCFFVGNLPKFFNLLESMTKRYLVEFTIHDKQRIIVYRKLHQVNFRLTFLFKVPS